MRVANALLRDPLLRLSIGLDFCLSAVYLSPWLSQAQRATLGLWADPVVLTLAVVAGLIAIRHETATYGRRFWMAVTVALSIWLGSELLTWASQPATESILSALVSDHLFLLYYAALGLAVTLTAKRAPTRRPLEITTILIGISAAVLVFSAVAYFIVIPGRVSPRVYFDGVSSLSLFVIFDLVLIARLSWLARHRRDPRWKVVFVLLAGSLGCTLVHDICELSVYVVGSTLPTGTVWELFWLAQFPLLVAAARSAVLIEGTAIGSRVTDHDAVDDIAQATPRALSSLVPATFILPIVHLTGRLANLLEPAFNPYRDVLVLATTTLLGALAVLHSLLLRQRIEQMRGELLSAQDLLQHSRKMEALGRLAGGIAHDFNNQLSVILGYTELLIEQREPGDPTAEPVDAIRLAAERAALLTRQLSVFSRGGASESRDFELDVALTAALPLLERVIGDRCEVVLQEGAPGAWLRSDPRQFERALINLVANARDAMLDGGLITVTSAVVELGDGTARPAVGLPPGEYVEVEVLDEGAGISPEARAHLFEPFFTTRPREKHRGLGLSTVYGFASRSGGHVALEDRQGGGTVARLLFPAQPAPPEPLVAPAGPVPRRSATVLVAEDERGLRRLLRGSLDRAGFAVLEAPDGQAAFDLATQYEGRIDLLLSDVVMPGMRGPELATRLRMERPEMQALFISGFTTNLIDLQAGSEPGLAYMQKPFTMHELVARVRSLVGVPDASGSSEEGPSNSRL